MQNTQSQWKIARWVTLGAGAVAWALSRRGRGGRVVAATLAAVTLTAVMEARQTRRIAKVEEREKRIDEAIDQSFPASDPPAHQIIGAEPVPTEGTQAQLASHRRHN